MDAPYTGATGAGLIALPKPVIAHVERDHFIVVTAADRKQGVAYICSDCGPWPGGRVRLTWNQWHMMDADVYGVVTKPGTASDDWMAAVLQGKRPPAQVAGLGPLRGLIPALEERALIRMAIVGPPWTACQSRPNGPVCPWFICGSGDGGGPPSGDGGCDRCDPLNDGGSGSDGGSFQSTEGPSSGDPVDLPTGGEDYSPDPDLVVYNPVGPAVSFERKYVSVSNESPNFQTMGFGWSDNYDAQLVGQYGYISPGPGDLVMPDGAEIAMTIPSQPTAQNPRTFCSMESGAPVTGEWNYDGSAYGHFLFTFADRSQWRFDNLAASPLPWFRLTSEADRNGNAITLHYDPNSGLLTNITNSADTVLLSLGYTGNLLTSISDAYGRSVYYQTGTFGSGPTAELTGVSQIVSTGTVDPPLRYTYDYQILSAPGGEQVPFLHTITVPSPTGAGNSTATINNTPAGYVGSLVDANGNTRAYSFVDNNHTSVTVTNPQQQVAYSYTAGFNNDMSGTTVTDGAGTIVQTKVFADPDDPYRPSQVIDGNGSNLNPEVIPGSQSVFGATGTDAPATGTWDIILNGGAVANSGAPNGWTVSLNTATGANNFTIAARSRHNSDRLRGAVQYPAAILLLLLFRGLRRGSAGDDKEGDDLLHLGSVWHRDDLIPRDKALLAYLKAEYARKCSRGSPAPAPDPDPVPEPGPDIAPYAAGAVVVGVCIGVGVICVLQPEACPVAVGVGLELRPA